MPLPLKWYLGREVRRLSAKQFHGGSNPSGTSKRRDRAAVAHRAHNPEAGGSNPSPATAIDISGRMALELTQIEDILKAPVKKPVLQKAMEMQRRLRFHTETMLSPLESGLPASSFLDWVRGLLPADKFNTFVQLFKFPLPTVSLVEDIYRELERVFHSRNASSSYRFTDTRLEEDWAEYRKERLGEPGIWRSVGWRKMQVSPNSVLVVDMPEDRPGGRPEPYFYWLEPEDIVDYETSAADPNMFSWIVFRQPGQRLAVFDDTRIRVFQTDRDGMKLESELSNSEHGLGYCPARFFWTPKLNEKNPDIKKNPITKELSNLDWYLFFSLSKRHLDLYAPYPIYSAYEADCDFENNDTGEYCDGGFLRSAETNQFTLLPDGTVKKCPCCSEKRIAGPGSFLEVPVPNAAEGIADMRSPVQITSIDKDALDYNVDECVRLKDEIIVSVTGSGGTVSEKEAINETQVAANFESKTSVLNALKTSFELAQQFVDDTVCRLRYGREFISSSVSWGTEFYVFTVDELYKKYAKAKENGASDMELDAISQQILEVEYRNNPLVLQRMLILRQLEPYAHKTLDELSGLYDKGLVSRQSVMLKVNFSSYVNRFERENINIVEFGSSLPMRERIETIKEKLLEYVQDDENGGTVGNEPAEPQKTRRGGNQGA